MPETPAGPVPLGATILGQQADRPLIQGEGPSTGQRSSKKHRGRASDPETTLRRAQARHPYAVTQNLENKLRAAMAAQLTAPPGSASEQVLAEISCISDRLRTIQADAVARWGRAG